MQVYLFLKGFLPGAIEFPVQLVKTSSDNLTCLYISFSFTINKSPLVEMTPNECYMFSFSVRKNLFFFFLFLLPFPRMCPRNTVNLLTNKKFFNGQGKTFFVREWFLRSRSSRETVTASIRFTNQINARQTLIISNIIHVILQKPIVLDYTYREYLYFTSEPTSIFHSKLINSRRMDGRRYVIPCCCDLRQGTR